MLSIALHGYSVIDRLELESRLAQAVSDCRGWIVDEKSVSITGYRLRFEIALVDIADLYGALQQVELQFTPLAHRALTEMCLCRKHLVSRPQEETRIVSIDLYVGVLDVDRIRFGHFLQMHHV